MLVLITGRSLVQYAYSSSWGDTQKKGHLDMEAYKKKRKKSRAVTNFVTAFGANWL